VNRSLLLGLGLGFAAGVAVAIGMRPSLDATARAASAADAPSPTASTPRPYDNTLRPVADPKPLLADFPRFVEPVVETRRFEAARLVDDPEADLEVRAWRFSYNARGIIEIPNRLRARDTAVIVVHPWAVDDEWGWKTPQPNGAVDFCTPEKNALAYSHTKEVIDPFLKRLRGKAGLVLYSLIGPSDPIRRRAYRSIHATPSAAEQAAGREELRKALAALSYAGQPLPETLTLGAETPVIDYFRQFPGLEANDRYNGPGFWSAPVAVSTALTVDPTDVLIFDQDGYGPLRDFLKAQGIRHVLLTGYATDMCFCRTTAGYENLSRDFNVFLVGDATLATFPANSSPRSATNAHISYAALDHLITQVGWVEERTR
jgi:hypothetical protein